MSDVTTETSVKSTKDGLTNYTRPSSFDEVVGLENIKEIVRYDIEGAKKLGEPPPHYTIDGPAGSGKSTIGWIIAKMLNGNLWTYMGSDLKKEQDIHDLVSHSLDNDVVLIEEAHTMPKKIQTLLLIWMEEYRVYGQGGTAPAAKCSFIYPTTNSGLLTKALRTRCRPLHVSYYKTDEICEILRRAAFKIGLDLTTDKEALMMLARSSRGTPRIGIMHRLDPLRKIMVVDDLPYCKETITKLFQAHGINEWGLESNDLTYCNVLYEKLCSGNGRPVSKKVLMQAANISEDILDFVIEPYLQQENIISLGYGGRTLTDKGFDILDREPIVTTSTQALFDPRVSNPINLEELKKMLEEDPDLCRGGMKVLAPKLKLRYGPDNPFLQEILSKIGYMAKKRSGIIKI